MSQDLGQKLAAAAPPLSWDLATSACMRTETMAEDALAMLSPVTAKNAQEVRGKQAQAVELCDESMSSRCEYYIRRITKMNERTQSALDQIQNELGRLNSQLGR